MLSIKQIPAQATYAVRQPVLRPGKPIETCIFDGDDLPDTFHLGVIDDGAVVAVASIYKAGHDYFTEVVQYQLRGMAVLETYQRRGVGEMLLKAAERRLEDKKGEIIWFNAREGAVGFYKRLGYEIKGSLFEIPDVGPHYVMFKKLR